MAEGPPVRALAVLAVALTAAVSVPSWDGPGPRPGSLPWVAAAAGAGVTVGALVRLAPVYSPRRRAAWKLISAAVVLMTAAGTWLTLAYTDSHVAAVPSPPDLVFAAAYACLLTGVLLLFYRPAEETPRSTMLDGLLVGLAGATILESSLLPWLDGSSGTSSFARQATSRLYLVLDLCVLGTVLVMAGRDILSVRRWRLLVVTTLLLGGADTGYLRRAMSGDLASGAWYHPLYFLAALALAAAAWAPPPAARAHRVETARMVVVPGATTAVAAVILVWDHFERRTDLAVWLATLALVLVAVRAGLTVRHLRQLVAARRLALTDDVTGLPNRRWFLERLAAHVRQSPRGGFVVIVLGIDRFKHLNDTLGHHAGDEVLRDSAARLITSLEATDRVARIGGDEFAVLPTGGVAGAARAVASIRAAFASPIEAEGLALHVDVSIGTAQFPADGTDAESLLRSVDVALSDAKRSEEHVARYQANRDPFSRSRLALAAELRTAVSNGELSVAYQPIAEARTGRILAAEALVRWQHPAHGLVLPGAFLDIAQQTGLMRALTQVVLDSALEQCRRWHEAGLHVGVSVNLPPSALLDLRVATTVQRSLDAAGVPSEWLRLELTEDGLLEDPATAITVLRSIRDLGVSLAIDDYGTGFASLSYLRDLPVQSLKIDRSFIVGFDGRLAAVAVARNAAIVRSTVVLAHELGFSVVAEGVEDARTLDLLRSWDVDAVQGYHIARPGPPEEVARLCRADGSARR